LDGKKEGHQKLEAATVISERVFSTQYSSFWSDLVPLGTNFVRSINLKYINSYAPAIMNRTSSSRRALINEMASRVYALAIANGQSVATTVNDESLLGSATREAQQYITSLPGFSTKRLNRPSAEEIKEVRELATSMERYFIVFEPGAKGLIAPKFWGCGIINQCEGDIICGDTLYEIKAGDRKFRYVDFKQVLTYLGLNHASKQYALASVGLLNPRHCTYIKLSIEQLCNELVGRNSIDVLGEIVRFCAGPGVSK
jgi:hypothetical protein